MTLTVQTISSVNINVKKKKGKQVFKYGKIKVSNNNFNKEGRVICDIRIIWIGEGGRD